MVDEAPKAKQYYSDGFDTYASLWYHFGRERVVNKVLESLKRNPRFLAVLGPSGSGCTWKSTLDSL